MTKKILLAAFAALSLTAQAGGFLTNTNQNAAFGRNPALDSRICVHGAYHNPAGIAFLSDGFHVGVDWQAAFQTRTVSSAFGRENVGYPAPFSLGTVNGKQNSLSGHNHYHGDATAPVIPSIDIAYVNKRFNASFHFGVVGGGGKCEFDQGLGSLESQVAMLPVLVNATGMDEVSGYSINTFSKGKQYYYSGQLNLGYKVSDHWSVSIGGRLTYALCNYYGYVRDISVASRLTGGQYVPAATYVGALAQQSGMSELSQLTSLVGDRQLNCDQNGWGFAPVVGVHYHAKKWDVMARYEFKTRMRLKNKSINDSGISEFDDGKKVHGDVPALLAVGAGWQFLPKWRATAAFHYYFDKDASQYESKQKYLQRNEFEVLAGMEYTVNDRWLVSCGWQHTNYGLGKNSKYITDMSFVTRSNTYGLGAQVRLSRRMKMNMSVFRTFYKHYKKDQADYAGVKASFASQVGPLASQLTTGYQQLTDALGGGDATVAAATAKAILNNQASFTAEQVGYAKKYQAIGSMLGAMNTLTTFDTSGYDVFHRTNTVLGVGLEIDF